MRQAAACFALFVSLFAAFMAGCYHAPRAVDLTPEVAAKWDHNADPAGGDSAPKLTARERARLEFAATVSSWAAWLMTLLVIVGLGLLVQSFTPLSMVTGIDTRESATVLGLSAAVPVLKYALQAWGVLAADVLSLAALLAAVWVLAAVVSKFVHRPTRPVQKVVTP